MLNETDLILLHVARYVARGESVTDDSGEFTRAPSGVAHRYHSGYVECGFCGPGAVRSCESSIASARACYYRNRNCIKCYDVFTLTDTDSNFQQIF